MILDCVLDFNGCVYAHSHGHGPRLSTYMATYAYIYLHFWDNVTMTVQLALDYYLENWDLRDTSLRHIPRSYVSTYVESIWMEFRSPRYVPRRGKFEWLGMYAGFRGCTIPSWPVHCDANKTSALSARGRISDERWSANWRCQRWATNANCLARNMPRTIVRGSSPIFANFSYWTYDHETRGLDAHWW